MKAAICSVCEKTEFIFYESQRGKHCYLCYNLCRDLNEFEVKELSEKIKKGKVMSDSKSKLFSILSDVIEKNHQLIIGTITEGLDQVLFKIIDTNFKEVLTDSMIGIVEGKTVEYINTALQDRVKFFYDSMQVEINARIEEKMKEEIGKYFKKSTPVKPRIKLKK
jgi:hypothetical protein